MATWSGWQKDFLTNAELPNTADNRAVLTAWADDPNTDCKNNPIDLSHKTATSTACKPLPGDRTAQNYKSRADAIGAFTVQINSGNFNALRGAFRSGSPESVNDSQAVYNELRKWGSTFYSNTYLQAVVNAQPGSGGGSGNVKAARAHGGWADMQRSVNHHWPKSLRNSERLTRAALRSLHKAHKVRR